MIKLTAKQLKDFSMIIEEVCPEKLALEIVLPGEVQINEENMAHNSPRYGGIVKRVEKKLGDYVKAGEVLAVLENNATLVEFQLKSLIAGTVIERHIVLGENKEAGENTFTVADLSNVWIDLDVYQKDLSSIAKGQSVLVRAGHGIASAEAVITYTGPVVDEGTRTGLARVLMPNTDRRWKPGMFVNATVKVDSSKVPLAVKKSAIQFMDEKVVVFVEVDGGFEPREIKVGKSDSRFVEILSGVEKGERYVSEGSFVVKAQRVKSSIDPHAGHNH